MRKLPVLIVLTMLGNVGHAASNHGSDASDPSPAFRKIAKVTQSLERFRDSDVASAAGYVHYDGYDTFSMGEHWYNRKIYESGQCRASTPSHLQYLVIDGKRILIGTGYVCVPRPRGGTKRSMFSSGIAWHTHGPAWCLLPNGAAEDYRDLADTLPNQLTKVTWRKICERESGVAVSQDVRMLHTWNWIPHPGGIFAHENLAIPFLRLGLPAPDFEFLNSEVGKSVISTLKLAHGDTGWWYWRGFNVINATDDQRRLGWQILDQAKLSSETVQRRLLEIGDINDVQFAIVARDGDEIVNSMKDMLANILTAQQTPLLDEYLSSLQAHVDHEHASH